MYLFTENRNTGFHADSNEKNKKNQKEKKKIQQGCTIIAITGQRICCIIRTLNPSHCDAAYASFGAIAHSAEAHTRSEIAAVSGKRHL
jgi:hypothetical protein